MNLSGLSTFNQARIEWAIRLRYSVMPPGALEIPSIVRQLNAFRTGELREMGKTWEFMMERDHELATNADKRFSELSSLPWEIQSDGSADGDAHAEALQYFYDNITVTHALDQDKIGGMEQLLYDMGTAHANYYSVHEMLLRVDNPAAKEITAEFRHTPIWFFETRRGYAGYLEHIFDLYGDPCVQGEWLTCVGSGWMRALSVLYVMKALALSDWLTWSARYGSGFLTGKTDASKTDPAWAEAMEALTTLRNEGVCLSNRGVDFSFLEQASRTGQHPGEPIVDWCNRGYAMAFRGMDLATSSRNGPGGGGQTGQQNPVGASVQGEEAGIFLERDAKWATGYLRQRVDRPVIRFLFNQEPRAHVCVAPPTEDDTAEYAASIPMLVGLGLRVGLKFAYEKFGIPIPEADEPCLAQPALPAPLDEDGNPTVAAPPPPEVVNQPESPAKSLASTIPAQTWEESPIGAGADPRAVVQTASPHMPDPQVQAGSMLSQAGAAAARAFGPLSRTPGANTSPLPSSPRAKGFNPGPAFGYAIPNSRNGWNWSVTLGPGRVKRTKLTLVPVSNGYDADEPRDDHGRWTDIGGGIALVRHEGKWSTKSGGEIPAHAAALGIPPAWSNVTVAPGPEHDLQAVGYDAKGREQRIYSEAFTQRQAEQKFSRISELKGKADSIARQNEGNLRSMDYNTRENAAALKVIHQTGIRPGSDAETGAEKKAYGATTLEGRHVVKDNNGNVSLQFVGKKGVDLNIPVEDPATAHMLLERKAASGDNGKLFNTSDSKLRDYTHTLDGGSFKPKDFRTLKGTNEAEKEVAARPAPKTMKDYKKAVMDVAKKVSEKLGNTPTVALQSYISPHVFAGWKGGIA